MRRTVQSWSGVLSWVHETALAKSAGESWAMVMRRKPAQPVYMVMTTLPRACPASR